MHVLQLLEVAIGSLKLVTGEPTVEVAGEDDKRNASGHYNAGAGYGGVLAPRFLQVIELEPAQDGHLGQEEQDAEHRGEPPRHRNVPVHRLVRRILNKNREILTIIKIYYYNIFIILFNIFIIK